MKSVALLLLLASSLSAQTWHSGDTHVHQQTCIGSFLSISDIGFQKQRAGLDFVALQLWARWGDLSEYAALAPLIDGTEALPGVRYGLEVSGFPASQFGHLQALDIDTGVFPVDALWSGPIFDFYRTQGALLGYAHVTWTESYSPALFFAGLGAAYMAPIDVANRACDFVEVMDIDKLGVGPGGQPTSWRGLYYKLENAGLRIGLAAGSDDTCADSTGIGDPRTWALADSYSAWCDEIRAGRASIGNGTGCRVELEIGLQLTATLHGPPQDGVLEIVSNGQSVASIPYATAGEDVVLSAPLPTESAWVAARAPGAHTAAQYLIVNDEPIAVAQDAAYWVAYCDAFEAALPVFGVGPAQADIAAAIGRARDVYAALLARTSPWPAWASEYGLSTPACNGPISVGLTDAGKIDCLAAPSDAHGWLILGSGPAAVQTNGITLLVNLGLPYLLVPVTASQGGYLKAPLNLHGHHVFAQFVWVSDCGGALCSSDGLDAVVP